MSEPEDHLHPDDSPEADPRLPWTVPKLRTLDLEEIANNVGSGADGVSTRLS